MRLNECIFYSAKKGGCANGTMKGIWTAYHGTPPKELIPCETDPEDYCPFYSSENTLDHILGLRG